MDDPEALRQRAQEQLDHIDEMLAQRRQERAQSPQWQPPAPEPPAPVHREQSSHASSGRAPARRERPPPAPPAPDKITRVQHDAAGRITATEAYTGAGAAAARSWEGWVRSVLRAEIATVYEVVWDTVGTATGEITREEREKTDKVIAALTRRIEELERLAGDRQQMEKRYAAAAD